MADPAPSKLKKSLFSRARPEWSRKSLSSATESKSEPLKTSRSLDGGPRPLPDLPVVPPVPTAVSSSFNVGSNGRSTAQYDQDSVTNSGRTNESIATTGNATLQILIGRMSDQVCASRPRSCRCRRLSRCASLNQLQLPRSGDETQSTNVSAKTRALRELNSIAEDHLELVLSTLLARLDASAKVRQELSCYTCGSCD